MGRPVFFSIKGMTNLPFAAHSETKPKREKKMSVLYNHYVMLQLQLGELRGRLHGWAETPNGMRVLLHEACARGEFFAPECLAMLDGAMSPLARGGGIHMVGTQVGETIDAMRMITSETAPDPSLVPVPAQATAKEKQARQRAHEAERRVGAMNRTLFEAQRERDAINSRYGKLVTEHAALAKRAEENERLCGELVARLAKNESEVRVLRARVAALEASATDDVAEIEQHNEILLSDLVALRAKVCTQAEQMRAVVEDMHGTARFVKITETIARLVAEGAADAPDFVGDDARKVARTALEVMSVLDGPLNALMRVTCPFTAWRAWVDGHECRGALGQTARAVVRAVRLDPSSRNARAAFIAAMWQWAAHEGVGGADGRRLKEKEKATNWSAGDATGEEAPPSASNEMLAALVVARLRSFSRG